MRPLPQSDLDSICDQTEALWVEARDSRIFLTGGTGFFGCWLVESFLAANQRFDLHAQLTVLTRSPGSFLRKCPHLAAQSALVLVEGNVRDFAFPDGQFPYVIHAATETTATLNRERPLQLLSTIVDGTKRTLEFASTHGARTFLLVSSGAVYGPQPEQISNLREDYCGAPDSMHAETAYANGKRTAELMGMLYADATGMQVKVARCFAFVGPHLPLNAHFAIGNFILDALEGRPIQVRGDGTSLRSYLYASDLAAWLWTMLFKAPSKLAFNVGSDQAISIRDLAVAVSTTINPGLKVNVAGEAVAGAPPSSMFLP